MRVGRQIASRSQRELRWRATRLQINYLYILFLCRVPQPRAANISLLTTILTSSSLLNNDLVIFNIFTYRKRGVNNRTPYFYSFYVKFVQGFFFHC